MKTCKGRNLSILRNISAKRYYRPWLYIFLATRVTHVVSWRLIRERWIPTCRNELSLPLLNCRARVSRLAFIRRTGRRRIDACHKNRWRHHTGNNREKSRGGDIDDVRVCCECRKGEGISGHDESCRPRNLTHTESRYTGEQKRGEREIHVITYLAASARAKRVQRLERRTFFIELKIKAPYSHPIFTAKYGRSVPSFISITRGSQIILYRAWRSNDRN